MRQRVVSRLGGNAASAANRLPAFDADATTDRFARNASDPGSVRTLALPEANETIGLRRYLPGCFAIALPEFVRAAVALIVRDRDTAGNTESPLDSPRVVVDPLVASGFGRRGRGCPPSASRFRFRLLRAIPDPPPASSRSILASAARQHGLRRHEAQGNC